MFWQRAEVSVSARGRVGSEERARVRLAMEEVSEVWR